MGADFSTPMARETAGLMAELAGIFVRGAEIETGATLGWAESDAARLDDMCAVFLADDPPADIRHSMIMSIGAYLGELIIRATGGRWGYDDDERVAVIETGDGLLGWPHSKVARRFADGPQHSLIQYYRYAVHPDDREAIAAGNA